MSNRSKEENPAYNSLMAEITNPKFVIIHKQYTASFFLPHLIEYRHKQTRQYKIIELRTRQESNCNLETAISALSSTHQNKYVTTTSLLYFPEVS